MKRIRSPKSTIIHLLESAAFPIYVLDQDLVIVFANRALGTWQGLDPGELVGRRCEYHSHASGSSHAIRVAHCLCPPPDMIPVEGASLRLASVADESQVFTIQFVPLVDEQDRSVGVLAFGQLNEVDCEIDPRLDARRLHEALSQQRQRLRVAGRSDVVMGGSPQARRLQRQIALAAKSTTNVLIVGPAGSGRERCGRAIHALTMAADSSPLIPLDCALLDAELLQSTVAAFLQSCAELESAGVPVLLLLDVDKLEEQSQQELSELLTIEELAVRVVATAQMPLVELVREGRFRADLAEQLGTLVIVMPHLADRREDIPLLAQSLLEQANATSDRPVGGFTPKALELLVAYDWPQGYPELIAVVETALGAAAGTLVDAKDLPLRLHQYAQPEAVRRPSPVRRTLDQYLAAAESHQLKKALRQAKGNKAKAARLLGIPRTRLLRRLEQLELDQ